MAYEVGYRPGEFLVPYSRNLFVPGHGVVTIPTEYGLRAQMGSARGHEGLTDLVHDLGRSTKTRAIELYDKDTQVKTVVLGDEHTEAAELEDLGHAVMERNRERVKRTGRAMDFDELREKAGYPSRESFQERFQEWLRDRVARHRANPITDPFRQPVYPERPGNPVTFIMGENNADRD